MSYTVSAQKKIIETLMINMISLDAMCSKCLKIHSRVEITLSNEEKWNDLARTPVAPSIQYQTRVDLASSQGLLV